MVNFLDNFLAFPTYIIVDLNGDSGFRYPSYVVALDVDYGEFHELGPFLSVPTPRTDLFGVYIGVLGHQGM